MTDTVTIHTDLGGGRVLSVDVPVGEITSRADFLESIGADVLAERYRAMLAR